MKVACPGELRKCCVERSQHQQNGETKNGDFEMAHDVGAVGDGNPFSTSLAAEM
jgi:hypothetical protein